MTTAARLVLQDSRQALREFAGDLQGSRWRIIYMANIALLRTVYHVLKQRDVPSNSKLNDAFRLWDADLLKSKPFPEIYWEFIVSERNQLLKEYTATPVQEVTIPEVEFNLNTGQTEERGMVRHQFVIAEGPFIGQEQRRLIKDAIVWWQSQLDLLDKAAIAA